MSHFIKWIKEEIIHIIPAVIYFSLAFNLIFFTSGLNEPAGEVRYFSYLSVTFAALIVGKVLIIVNTFPFINAFPKKPLIYNILWKSFLYAIFTLIFWILEELFHLDKKYQNLSHVITQLKHELNSPAFLATILWLLSTLFIFVVFSEFMRVLGKEKIINILLKQNQS